jgi:N,N-dimethylformamidase
MRREWSDPDWRDAWNEQASQWNSYPYNPGAHPEYGLSTYNRQPDSTGISIAYWHRPMFNMRVG